MSLNFGWEKIENGNEKTTSPFDKDKYHPVFDALVWLSLVCGWNRIDDKTIDKVAERIAMWQEVAGAYLGFPDKDQRVEVYITRADLEVYKGMWTNASPKTDAEFNKTILTTVREAAHRKHDKSAYDIVAERAAKYNAEQAQKEEA